MTERDVMTRRNIKQTKRNSKRAVHRGTI